MSIASENTVSLLRTTTYKDNTSGPRSPKAAAEFRTMGQRSKEWSLQNCLVLALSALLTTSAAMILGQTQL